MIDASNDLTLAVLLTICLIAVLRTIDHQTSDNGSFSVTETDFPAPTGNTAISVKFLS